MRKIFIVLVMLYSSLNAGILLDLDNKTCNKSFCGDEDKECVDVLFPLCKIMLPTLVSTTEGEVAKSMLQYGSKFLIAAGQKLVEIGYYETKSEAYEKIMYFFGIRFEKLGQGFLYNGGFSGIDTAQIIDFIADVTFDICWSKLIDDMNEDAVNKFRFGPTANGRSEDIKQGLKWVGKVLFNDLKASAYAALGPKYYTNAFGAALVDNTLVLAEIGVKTTGAAFNYFDSKTALTMSQKRGEMFDLYWKYEGPYLRLRKSVEEENKLKEETLNFFLIECKKIKLDISEFAVSNWAYPLEGYGAQLNQELSQQCDDYHLRMQKNNQSKIMLLYGAIHNYSKERFNKLVEYYFHHDDWPYYKKLYDVYNFDPQTGYPKNHASYKYIKKLYAYGVDFYSYGKFVNYAGEYGSIQSAAGDISDALKNYYNINKTASTIISNGGYSEDSILTRHKYGKLLADNFNLQNIFLDKNKNATYKQLIKKGISDSDARLSALGILPIYPSQNIYTMKIKYYQTLQMIADTLDVVTCGHKGCSYEEILKGGN